MRVLVTRARDDGARTAERLRASGYEAVQSPVIEIVATGAALPDAPVDAILATSVHALAGVVRLPQALAGAPWLVVGERLRDALARENFGAPECVASDVTALLVALDDRYPEAFRFLYLTGRDRKDTLEIALQQRGHDLAIVETYDARAVATLDPAAAQALKRGTIDVVLHFSRRSAELFVQHVCGGATLQDNTAALRHIVISADAAAPLLAQGWRVEIAERPNEDAMLAMLM